MGDGGITETALLAASLAATAASTGISFYGQQQQAENAQSIANYNAAVQQQNAQVQARMAMQQSTWQQQAQRAQYQAQQNNAVTLENQARAVEAQGRAQVDRERQRQEQMLAMQRAHYAKAGVVNEGSPLAVLADTAKTTELGIQDMAYQSDLESRQLQQKAADERFQSGFSLMDASIEQYKQASIPIGQQIAYREADLTRMQGTSAAEGYRTAAGATLLTGAASMAQTGFEDYYRLPSSNQVKPAYAAH